MTDFRALCVELVESVEVLLALRPAEARPLRTTEDRLSRARAALADGPAVPDGREPASVTGQPSDEELDELAWNWYSKTGSTWYQVEAFRAFARAVLARWGNPAPVPPADVSQLSDGYHTFAELYEHRYSLMLALMRALPRICWFSRRHADGELPFGSDDWFIVGAELPGAPITYHLPTALYSLAQKTGALELPVGRPWDGHSAADVVHRLRDWAIAPAPPADGEVAELVARLSAIRNDYGLRHSADCQRAADLLHRLSPPQPVPVSVSDALIKAECALSDIAEGEPMTDEGDPLQWAERRCADTLAIIRPTMRQHKIRTSEWPPLPPPTDKEPTRLRNCPTHGQQPPWAWGCPECVRQLREELAALQQRHPEPVPVSERLPGPEDCDAEGRCWWGRNESDDWSADWTLATHEAVAEFCEFCPRTVWLPAHALPLPGQEVR